MTAFSMEPQTALVAACHSREVRICLLPGGMTAAYCKHERLRNNLKHMANSKRGDIKLERWTNRKFSLVASHVVLRIVWLHFIFWILLDLLDLLDLLVSLAKNRHPGNTALFPKASSLVPALFTVQNYQQISSSWVVFSLVSLSSLVPFLKPLPQEI